MLSPLAPRPLSAPPETLERFASSLRGILPGQAQAMEWALIGLVSGGHVLLEGPPGVGKTTLARALARQFERGEEGFRRIQMTSDLLPSEITGALRPLGEGSRALEFRKGPVFSHFLFLDELNRASPKTQSALLEAMAEGQVSVDGETYPLPSPFFVIATQNPLDDHGVYPLPENQLDRFALAVPMSLPDAEAELAVYRKGALLDPGGSARAAPLPLSAIRAFQALTAEVRIEDTVLEYFHALLQATRAHPDVVLGVSVRGGLQSLAAVRARARIHGRDYALPEDVAELAVPTLAHRLRLRNGGAEMEPKRERIREILATIEAPR